MEETKEIVKSEGLSKEDIKTLTEVGVIPKDCNPHVIKLYAKICAESNLNPFKRQVHLVPRKKKNTDGSYSDSYTIQIGIDGYRAIASRTGEYAGNDDPIFDNEDKPTKATVTVYRMVNGIRCPFTATARWKEYYPGERLGFMWDNKPLLMLSKCAESLALRKAFPEELSGTYTDEEMQQADTKLIPTDISALGEISEETKPTPMGKAAVPVPIRPASSNICTSCSKPISSHKVIDYSLQKYGKILCFNCQKEQPSEEPIAEGKEEYEQTDYDYSEPHEEVI